MQRLSPAAPHLAGEFCHLCALQVRDGADPQPVQLLHGDRPHAGHGPGGQRGDHLHLAAGWDHHQAVGFGHLAGHLGDELAGADAHAGGEPLGALEQVGAQLLAQGAQLVQVVAVVAPGLKVDEGLVDAERFHQRRQLAQQRHHDPAGLAVGVEAAAEHGGVRCAPTCLVHRHGGSDPVGAGLVGGRRHHAPAADATHDHGLAAQGGLVALLDGGEEGVEVQVEDAGGGPHRSATGAP